MFEEDELYDAFGVEAPQPETPPQEPPADDAPPQEPPSQAGGTEPTGAEPEAPAEEDPIPEPGAPQEPPAQPAASPASGPETQARQAAYQAQVDAAYAEAYKGRINPYTGKPILSKADYDAYQRAYQQEMHNQALEKMRSAGIDPDVLSELISRHPTVQQAQTAIRQAQAQQRAAQEVQARNWYAGQMREISALDPAIKSLGDLQAKHPDQYPKLMQLVSSGMTLAQAYKGLNFDALAARKAEAAQQQVRNQVAGKRHLEPVGGQGKASVEVPGDVAEQYRDLNPGMSDAEIQKAYAAYLKQIGT